MTLRFQELIPCFPTPPTQNIRTLGKQGHGSGDCPQAAEPAQAEGANLGGAGLQSEGGVSMHFGDSWPGLCAHEK